MITPLIVFKEKLPQETLDQIQQYLPPCDIVVNALKKHYDELYDEKLIADEEAFEKLIYPNCRCRNCPDNGQHKIFNRKDCWYCDEYEMKEYNDYYASEEYKLVITNNPQFKKIAYGINIDDDDYSVDYFWYNDK